MQNKLIILSLLFTLNAVAKDANTFNKFAGVWILKQDLFEQVWDGKTVEKLKIPNHNTKCEPINTQQSIFCIVEAGSLQGHIFWTYDTSKKQVYHLSHFGESRNGVGKGSLDSSGNLTTRVSFQGEPEGSYRVYQYSWVSKDEYTMLSTQFDLNGEPTGNWYGGTFIRK